MSDRGIQLLFIMALISSLYLVHRWNTDGHILGIGLPDVHALIEEEIRPMHQDLLVTSSWPEPVPYFDPATKARIDVWKRGRNPKITFPHYKKTASLELRGEIMIPGRVYGTDTVHSTLEDLAPLDIGYGIGPALRDDFAKDISVWFSNRTAHFTIPNRKAGPSLANMHLIPASPELRDAIMRAEADDFFVLRGYLVTFRRKGFAPWASDTQLGNNDCEIILVTEFQLSAPDGHVRTRAEL